ncbi:MAG: hypothetical protein WCD79_12180 [Chthoniobacteraceae bacterium]
MHHLQKYLLLPAALLFLSLGSGLGQTAKQPLITVPESHSSPADVKPSPSVDKLVDTFFTLLAKNQIDQAYDQLTAGTEIAKKTGDVGLLKSKTTEAIKMFGAVKGYELVAIKNVGTHLMCATYLSIGESLPLRWKLYFYKSDQTWRLIDIRVDDRLVDMFDERNPHPQAADEQ